MVFRDNGMGSMNWSNVVNYKQDKLVSQETVMIDSFLRGRKFDERGGGAVAGNSIPESQQTPLLGGTTCETYVYRF